jgi:hypothetical protein
MAAPRSAAEVALRAIKRLRQKTQTTGTLHLGINTYNESNCSIGGPNGQASDWPFMHKSCRGDAVVNTGNTKIDAVWMDLRNYGASQVIFLSYSRDALAVDDDIRHAIIRARAVRRRPALRKRRARSEQSGAQRRLRGNDLTHLRPSAFGFLCRLMPRRALPRCGTWRDEIKLRTSRLACTMAI